MDQTFKVFDKMIDHKYKGMMDVDPDAAEASCLHDYKALLKAKMDRARADINKVKQEMETFKKAKEDAQVQKNIEDMLVKQAEEAKKKLEELRGSSSAIVPILSEEEMEQRKRDQEVQRRMVELAKEAEKATEAMMLADFTKKINELQLV